MKRILALATLLCLLASLAPFRLPAQASSKYYITVDLTNQIVTVYKKGNTSESGIVRQMICSTGRAGHATPTGTFTLPSKRSSAERTEWYYFSKYNCYAKWATRIVGGILFHSVIYTASKSGPTRSSVSALGSVASHGCVRLRVDDAKWIAKNCPAGTKCRVFKSGKTNSSLRNRLKKRSFSVSSETYDHFMGRSGDGKQPLSRGSNGDKVKKLQKRLRALGFLNDSVDGKFGAKTEAAVKYFQTACGKKKTGKVDDALWTRIFADDAPTGTYVTLSRGTEGPAVAVLQRALNDLLLFDGTADGAFSADTETAVKDYQRYFSTSVSGKANQALQKDILQRAASVRERFGDGGYRLSITEEEVSMARVKGASKVTLYAKAKKGSKTVTTAKKNAEVEVLSTTGSWSRVKYKGKKGYVQNKYLTFFTGTRSVAAYEAQDAPPPSPEVSIPTTPPEVSIPTTPPEVSIPGSDVDEGSTPKYAVALNDGVKVYAQAEANDDNLLAELNSGAAVEVEQVADEWVRVRLDGATGYVRAGDVQLTDELPGEGEQHSADLPDLSLADVEAPEAEPVEEDEGAHEVELELEAVEAPDDSDDDTEEAPEIELELEIG